MYSKIRGIKSVSGYRNISYQWLKW